MVLLKNKPIFIAIITLSIIAVTTVIALAIIAVTTVIALEKSISVSDGMETEGIPVTSNNEPITSSSSIDALWSGDLTLTLSNLPTLWETAEVVLVVNNTSGSTLPASFFATVIYLSEHFEILNPPSNIQSFDHGFFITEPMSHDIQPNEILTINWTLIAVEEGEAAIFGGGLSGSTGIRLVIGAEETLLKEDFDRLYPNNSTRDEDLNKVVDNSNPFEGMTDDQIREIIEQLKYEDDEIEEILVELKEHFAK